MFTILVILAIILQIAIALGVYFKRRGKNTNTIFMFLTIALAGWAFINYLAIKIPQNPNTIYAIRTVLTLVVIENTLFFLFAKTYPDKEVSQLPKYSKYVIAYSFLVMVLTQSPFVFKTVTIEHGTANPNPAPAILFFIIQAILTIFLGLAALIKHYNFSKGLRKRQLGYIIVASTILWLIVPITNFALTLVFKTTAFVKFSPFYTLVFGAFITYAIITQRLFDIRAAIARSVAYAMLIASIVITYSLGLFGIINVLFSNTDQESERQILSVVLVFPLILCFQPLKRFFDKLTKSVFYNDAYDSQEFLDMLNQLLVGSIDTNSILQNVAKHIQDNIKCEFALFYLTKTATTDSRLIGTTYHGLDSSITDQLKEKIPELHHKIVEVEDIGNDNHQVASFLEHNNIAVVGRLTRASSSKSEIGYIILGQKKNGASFTKQDIDMVQITTDELAIAIENALSFEEIQRFNTTLEDKIEKATYQLRKANTRLKTLDEAKDDFISMASHQLRTPLTIIKGYIKMVVMGDAGKINDRQSSNLTLALNNSERMTGLVTDLLNVSRITSGKFKIEEGPVNLSTLVDNEVKQLMNMVDSHKITLTFQKPEKFPLLMLDEEKTKQVVINFIDNAIHYSKPEGGKIDIQLTTNNKVEFKVVDNGIGVPEAEKEKLFAKFYRAKNAQKARPDGTGIGLYLSKVVITEEGGNVIFESKEGVGSTFGFSFNKNKIVTDSSKVS